MANLIDRTETHNRADRADMEGWQKRLQVIYMTDRADYCREPGPVHIVAYADAAAWAHAQFGRIADATARRAVTSFRIEFW